MGGADEDGLRNQLQALTSMESDEKWKTMSNKEKGTEMFRQGRFAEALDFYSQAIAQTPSDHTLYSNRSACSQKLGQFENALKDADSCIKLKSDWIKGYTRKSQAI